MPLTNEQIVDIVLRFEGGFVNNPADHGGATNFGITAATLGRYRGLGRSATFDEVHALTRAEAVQIYLKNYVNAPGFDQVICDPLRLALVDSGVLHGPSRAIAWLRQCIKLPSTPRPVTQLDTDTLRDVNAANDPARLALTFLGLRLKSLASIVAGDRTQAIFLVGWVNRVSSLLEEVV